MFNQLVEKIIEKWRIYYLEIEKFPLGRTIQAVHLVRVIVASVGELTDPIIKGIVILSLYIYTHRMSSLPS
jgi:hypothetical protein